MKKCMAFFVILLYLSIHSSASAFPGKYWEGFSRDSIYNLAESYMDDNRFVEANEMLHFLVRNSQGEKKDFLRKIYSNLGYNFYNLGRIDSSITAYLEVYKLAVETGEVTRQIGALKSIGMNYNNMGLYSLSLEQYQKALALATESGDEKALADLNNSIGLLYNSLGDYRQALGFFTRSIASAVHLDDSLLMAYGYNNLAWNYNSMEKNDSSLFFNFRALEIKNKLKNLESKASTLNNIGLDYKSLGDFDLSEKYFMEALDFYRKANSLEGLIIVYNNLADLHLNKGQPDKAKDFLDVATGLLKQTDLKEWLVDHLELQVKYYERKNNFREAFFAEKELNALKQQLFQEEKLKTKDVETFYILNEKEKEVIISKSESSRFLNMVVFLGFTVILLGMLTLVYVSFSREFKIKYEVINLQKTDLLHRTGNVLTRLQAALRSIAEEFTDEGKEKIRIAEAVVVSAGTLQNFTYGIDQNDKKIALGDYLKELVDRLMKTFVVDGRDVSYRIDIRDDFSLPVDRVLNTAILVSEIVLNAIKHAGKNTEGIEISINLVKTNKHYVLSVKDNGRGMDRGKSKEGIGLGMVNKLVKYIKAEMEMVSSLEGTSFTITFKNS